MVDIKRIKGESFESFFRKFTRRVQQSGMILQSRKYRCYQKDPNDAKVKKSAIRRLELGEKREYLIRTGQLIEDKRGQGRGRR